MHQDGPLEDRRKNEALEALKVKLALEMVALMPDPKILAGERRLRALRNFQAQVKTQLSFLRWTQAELASITDIHQSRLSHILSINAPNVTVETLYRIAEALDCSLDIRLTSFIGQQLVKTDKPLPRFKDEAKSL